MARAILKRRNICNCKDHGYDGNYTTQTSGEATCVTPAGSYKVCHFCKTIYDSEEGAVNPDNHANRTEFEQVDATCTEDGSYSGWSCGACKQSGGGGIIPALGHNYDISNVSIKDSAIHIVPCSRCDKEESHTTITGKTILATCSSTGLSGGESCEVCSWTRGGEVLPKDPNNHVDMQDYEEVEATCTKSGYKAGQYCSGCEEDTREVIKALGHDFSTVDYAYDMNRHWHPCSRCDEKNEEETHTPKLSSDSDYHWYACQQCGYFTSSKTLHAWDEGSVTKSPTCTAAGERTYECLGCSESKQEIVNALGHTADIGDGVLHYYSIDDKDHGIKCARCGATGVVGSKSPHNFGNTWAGSGNNIHSGTCQQCGRTITENCSGGTATCETRATCEKCNKTYGSLGSHTPGAAATCTTVQTCTTCGNVVKEALGHSLGTPYYYPAPTCTQTGVQLAKCNRAGCGATVIIDDKVPAKGHSYKDTVVEPTCDTVGYTLHKCSNCEDEYKDNQTSALGHNESMTTTATCTSPGVTTYTCKTCENKRVEPNTPALGHDWNDWAPQGDTGHYRCCKRNSSHSQTGSHTTKNLCISTCTTCGYGNLGHEYDGNEKTTCNVKCKYCDGLSGHVYPLNSNTCQCGQISNNSPK